MLRVELEELRVELPEPLLRVVPEETLLPERLLVPVLLLV